MSSNYTRTSHFSFHREEVDCLWLFSSTFKINFLPTIRWQTVPKLRVSFQIFHLFFNDYITSKKIIFPSDNFSLIWTQRRSLLKKRRTFKTHPLPSLTNILLMSLPRKIFKRDNIFLLNYGKYLFKYSLYVPHSFALFRAPHFFLGRRFNKSKELAFFSI